MLLQNKQMLSALPPLATGERTFRIGSFVPIPALSRRSNLDAEDGGRALCVV
jgi:hypothetical protein